MSRLWGGPPDLLCINDQPSREKPLEGIQSSPQGLTGNPPGGKSPLGPTGTASSQSLDHRALKRAHPYIPWKHTPAQAQEAYDLLWGRGCSRWTSYCSFPMMTKDASRTSTRMAYCLQTFSSRLDGQGHTLSSHSEVRNNPLCQ